MANFKPLKIDEILGQIDRGLTPDLGYLQWNQERGQFIVNVGKLRAYTTTVVKGVSGHTLTIHRKNPLQ
jgi:hypothetical protein